MERNRLVELRKELSGDTDWPEIFLRVHSAGIRMGSFQNPFEESLVGLTPMQWEEETAKRHTLAVLDYLLEKEAHD